MPRDGGNQKPERDEERKICDGDRKQKKEPAPIRRSERNGEEREEQQRQGDRNRQRDDEPEPRSGEFSDEIARPRKGVGEGDREGSRFPLPVDRIVGKEKCKQGEDDFHDEAEVK